MGEKSKIDWGSLGTSALSGIGDLISTQTNAFSNYLYNSSLMDKQNELNKDFNSWNYTNAPQLQRAGLERAGYNPILAVNNGSTYSGGSAGLGSVNVNDSNRASNAYRVGLERKQVGYQGKSVESQINLNRSQEDVNNAVQLMNNAKTNTEYFTQKNLEANTEKTFQDIINSRALTNAQVVEMLANAGFQKRRSGGYSYSESSSDGSGATPRVIGGGPLRYQTKEKYGNKSRSRSWTY